MYCHFLSYILPKAKQEPVNAGNTRAHENILIAKLITYILSNDLVE